MKKLIGLFVVSAFALFLPSCGGDSGISTGSISGSITYTGSEAGTHTLYVGVNTEVSNDTTVAMRSYPAVSKAKLQDGYAYSVTGIPPGTYYLFMYWDIDDDSNPEGQLNAIGYYGGLVTPRSFAVSAGADTPGINVTLEDGGGGGTTLFVSAGIGWNFPNNGDTMALAEVAESGTPVDDATVTVNSTVLPWDGNAGSGAYGIMDNTTFSFTGGDDVILSVTRGAYSVGATLQMPDQPNVTAPTSGTYTASTAISVEWDAISPTPTFIQVIISPDYTVDVSVYLAMVPGSATSHSIPANTLKTETVDIFVFVAAYVRTSSLGADAAAESQLGVSNTGVSVEFNTQ